MSFDSFPISSSLRKEMADKRAKVGMDFDCENCVIIGRGTYGSVFKTRPLLEKKDQYKDEFYALKLLKNRGLHKSALREIAIMNELDHENTLKLLAVYTETHNTMYLLFPYAEYDLYSILSHHRYLYQHKQYIIQRRMVKAIMFQFLTGLAYLHENYILHRDLKPANILVMGDGPEKGTVKIADFGLSRCTRDPLTPMTVVDPVVVTAWYRAPEILLNAQHYSSAIDMWSAGAMFVELCTLEVMFFSANPQSALTPYDPAALRAVFSALGFPKREEWPTMTEMPEYLRMMQDIRPADFAGQSFGNYCKTRLIVPISAEISLMKGLLRFCSKARLTAQQALQHQYFAHGRPISRNIFEHTLFTYPLRQPEIQKKPQPDGDQPLWFPPS